VNTAVKINVFNFSGTGRHRTMPSGIVRCRPVPSAVWMLLYWYSYRNRDKLHIWLWRTLAMVALGYCGSWLWRTKL